MVCDDETLWLKTTFMHLVEYREVKLALNSKILPLLVSAHGTGRHHELLEEKGKY